MLRCKDKYVPDLDFFPLMIKRCKCLLNGYYFTRLYTWYSRQSTHFNNAHANNLVSNRLKAFRRILRNPVSLYTWVMAPFMSIVYSRSNPGIKWKALVYVICFKFWNQFCRPYAHLKPSFLQLAIQINTGKYTIAKSINLEMQTPLLFK